MMRLILLPVNQVYVFKFGDGLIRLYLPENLGPAPLFFPTLEAAMRVAGLCGLRVGSDGAVEVKEEIKVVSRRYDEMKRERVYRFTKGSKMYETRISDDETIGLAREVEEYVFKNGKEVES